MAAQQAQLAGDFGFVAVALQLLPVGKLGEVFGCDSAGQPVLQQGQI